MTKKTHACMEVENAKKNTLSALTYVPRWIMSNGSTAVVAAVMIGTSIMINAGLIAYTRPLGVFSPNSRTMYLGKVPSLSRVVDGVSSS